MGAMETGSVLGGRYAIGQTIGVGGMGEVHVATDRVLGRQVAVKTVRVGGAGGPVDPTSLERFRREAVAVAALQHPHVVTIYDTGVDGDTAFLVMELLPGPDLATVVARRGPLPEAQVRQLAAQVAAGLGAAHRAGIVHRDIKPANLVFDAQGGLRIVDFGIARLEHAGARGLTATDTVLGSAHYLSPEQVEGRPADARSDLYALGCVMTTMLTGRPPFDAEHAIAVAHQHLGVAAPPIQASRPDVSPELAELVAHLLAKAPEHRPQSATDVLARLQSRAGAATTPLAVTPATAAMTTAVPSAAPTAAPTAMLHTAGGPAGHTRVMAVSPAPTAVPVPPTRPPHTPAPRRRLKKRRVALVVLGLVVVALAAANLAGSLRDASQPSGAPTVTPRVTVSTTPPPSSTPEDEPTTPAPEPPTDGETLLATSLDALRGAVSTVAAAGGLDEKGQEELGKRIDEIAEKAAELDPGDAGRRVRDLRHKVEDLQQYAEELVDRDRLTQAGQFVISAAVEALASAVEVTFPRGYGGDGGD